MIRHINELKRFDFTSECKTCKFRKDLGNLEYICGFVFEEMQKERLLELQKHILEYVLFDDELDKINPNNALFEEESIWGVTLLFQTNLREEYKLILREIRRALQKSPYFTNVNFINGSLYKQKYDSDKEYVETTLDKYLKEKNKDKGLV